MGFFDSVSFTAHGVSPSETSELREVFPHGMRLGMYVIAMLRVWCWISLKIRLSPEAFLCLKLGNCLFQIQGVSELLWCIKLSYFAENRWCPNINGSLREIFPTDAGQLSDKLKFLAGQNKILQDRRLVCYQITISFCQKSQYICQTN